MEQSISDPDTPYLTNEELADNKNLLLLDEVARSVVKTHMESIMLNSDEEPRGLASGGFDLDDDEELMNDEQQKEPAFTGIIR